MKKMLAALTSVFQSCLVTCLLLASFAFVEVNAETYCYEICTTENTDSETFCEEDNEILPLTISSKQTTKTWEYADSKDLPDYQSGQLYVKIRANTKVQMNFTNTASVIENHRLKKLIKQYDIYSVKKAFSHLEALEDVYKFHFANNSHAKQLIEELEVIRFIEYAERVPLYKLFYTPNDINANQYNVQQVMGEEAWDITTGESTVVIGLVDDAVMVEHSDLADNMWVNAGEIAGNGIDDDGNGYIDDINGWDAADDDNNPSPPTASADDNTFSHGTHCAGIASAVTDNSNGIAGMGFNTTIMGVKCTPDSQPGGAIPAAMEGVEYAVAAGADVISMSWGGGPESATDQAVFDAAHDLGIVLVAAAGNDNTDALMYPASYNHIISVGASDQNDMKASFSNYGDSIDVMAPGVGIYSSVATNEDSYTDYDGTSMACPLVSGVVSLMLSFDPNLPPNQIEACIKSTADDIYDINPDYVDQLGAGRVNAFQALQCLQVEPVAALGTDFIGTGCPGQPIQFTDESWGVEIETWVWSFPGGTPSSSTEANPVVTYSTAGDYDVTLTVTNEYGTATIMETITIAPPMGTIYGDNTIIAGYVTDIFVELTGTPPWDVTYTDGTQEYTIEGVEEPLLVIPVSPSTITTYTLVSVTDLYCDATVGGSAVIFSYTPDDCTNCPYYLVEQVLLGSSCLQVANVVYTGDSLSLDYFEQSDSLDIGIDAGVILASGEAQIIYGPNDSPGETYNLGVPGDSDLTDLIGDPTNDAAVLEFDFIPSTDSLSFTYVFASEEYLEFVNSSFNDVFAFFISGPGITGLENIAIVPGTTNVPVSINNVNDGSYSEFYVNNPDGESNTQFDGYTTPLLAVVTGLTACEVYHIKLAVADVVDSALDSGVFIEANSFSDGSEVDVTSTGAVDGTLEVYEGCQTGSFTFVRKNTEDLSEPFSINISMGGTAIPGVDYAEFPDVVTIPAGDSTYTVYVEAYLDGIEESLESIVVQMDDIQCDCTTLPVNATLLLFDNTSVDAGPNVNICAQGSVQLQATGNGVDFQWTPEETLLNPTTANPIALPTETTWYYVETVDINGCTAIDSMRVFVSPPPFVPELTVDTTICTTDTVYLELNPINPISNYTYLWFPADGLSEADVANPVATITESIDYVFSVANPQGCQTTQIISINVETLETGISIEDTTLCNGETIIVEAADGFTAYNWSDGTTGPAIAIENAGEYTITVTSPDGCEAEQSFTVELEPQPAPEVVANLALCAGDETSYEAADGFASYNWSDGTTDRTIMIDVVGEYTVTVTYDNGCSEEHIVVVDPLPSPEPTITGNIDIYEDESTQLSATAGFATYDWSTGDATQVITVTGGGDYTVTVTSDDGCLGEAELSFVAKERKSYIIPTAFSPNNDGRNDEFRIIGEDITTIELYVYNRWGEQVFFSNNQNVGWNGQQEGKQAELGSYIYFGTIVLGNGETVEIRGNVSLVR